MNDTLKEYIKTLHKENEDLIAENKDLKEVLQNNQDYTMDLYCKLTDSFWIEKRLKSKLSRYRKLINTINLHKKLTKYKNKEDE